MVGTLAFGRTGELTIIGARWRTLRLARPLYTGADGVGTTVGVDGAGQALPGSGSYWWNRPLRIDSVRSSCRPLASPLSLDSEEGDAVNVEIAAHCLQFV